MNRIYFQNSDTGNTGKHIMWIFHTVHRKQNQFREDVITNSHQPKDNFHLFMQMYTEIKRNSENKNLIPSPIPSHLPQSFSSAAGQDQAYSGPEMQSVSAC